MLSQHYIDMTSQKSAIRELFDYGSKRAKEIGYENVFDYSLGNPRIRIRLLCMDIVQVWVFLLSVRQLRIL